MASDSGGHCQATKLVQPKQPTPNQVHRERPSRRGRSRTARPHCPSQQRGNEVPSGSLADVAVRGDHACEQLQPSLAHDKGSGLIIIVP